MIAPATPLRRSGMRFAGMADRILRAVQSPSRVAVTQGLPALPATDGATYRRGMSHTGQWKVDLFPFDNDAEVTAGAVLHADSSRPVMGRGAAGLHAVESVPQVNAELAAARAPTALGTRLPAMSTGDLRDPAGRVR
jgi:uncharacterized protein DUF1876